MEQAEKFRWIEDFMCDGDCANCGRCTSTVATFPTTSQSATGSLSWWDRLCIWFDGAIVPVEKWLHYHGIKKCDWLD